MRSHLTSQPANEGPALFVNIFLGNLFIYFFATIFATNCQPILQPISQTIVNQFCNQLSINVSTNCQSIVNYSATNSKNLTTNNGQNFRSLRSCFYYMWGHGSLYLCVSHSVLRSAMHIKRAGSVWDASSRLTLPPPSWCCRSAPAPGSRSQWRSRSVLAGAWH